MATTMPENRSTTQSMYDWLKEQLPGPTDVGTVGNGGTQVPGAELPPQPEQPQQPQQPTQPQQNQQPQGWSYQGQGFQPVDFTTPTPFTGGGFTPPPPPAPPPPPPPPPDFSGMGGSSLPGNQLLGDVEQYARDWMDNPNRYLSDLATATREAGDLRLAQQWAEGQRGIEEWAQSRGLIGSSYEGDQMVALQEALRRQQAAEEAQLLEFVAGAEAAGRQAAGQFGLGTAQTQMNDALARAGLDLNAAIAGDAAAMSRVNAELDRFRAMDAATLSRAQMEQQQQQIDMQAWAIYQDAIARHEQMSFEQARTMAEYEMRQNQMAQDESQFGRSMWQNQQQYDRAVGLQILNWLENTDMQLTPEQQAEFAQAISGWLGGAGLPGVTPGQVAAGGDDAPQGSGGPVPIYDGSAERLGLPTMARIGEFATDSSGRRYVFKRPEGEQFAAWYPV